MSEPKTNHIFDRSQLIVIGVAVVMLGCFIGLVCVPDARKLGAIHDQLDAAQNQWDLQKTEIESLPELSRRVAELKEQNAAEVACVPEDPDLPRLLGRLATILKEGKARQHEIVPGQSRAGDRYVEVPINVKFESTFETVYRTLSRLESLDRVIQVESLKLSKTPGDNNAIAVEMRLVVYYAHPAGNGSPAVAAAGQGGGRG